MRSQQHMLGNVNCFVVTSVFKTFCLKFMQSDVFFTWASVFWSLVLLFSTRNPSRPIVYLWWKNLHVHNVNTRVNNTAFVITLTRKSPITPRGVLLITPHNKNCGSLSVHPINLTSQPMTTEMPHKEASIKTLNADKIIRQLHRQTNQIKWINSLCLSSPFLQK